MSFFLPRPWMPPPFKGLQPELLPGAAAGSFTANVPAGSALATGAAGSVNIGLTFTVPQGAVLVAGQPGSLAAGRVDGFTGQFGFAVLQGFTGAVQTQDVPPAVLPPEPSTFEPTLSSLALDAWERCGKQAGEITTNMFVSMRRSMNLVLSRWANRGVNLWKVDQVAIPMLPGIGTYTLPGDVVDVLDTYRQTGSVTGNDILITQISRETYAAIPNKAQTGAPNMIWVDRLVVPTITVWPLADRAGVYTLFVHVFRQVADADPAMGNSPDLPYRFLEAFTAALAAHLAMKWAPERAVALKGYADECWTEAETEDREKTTTVIVPNTSAFWN